MILKKFKIILIITIFSFVNCEDNPPTPNTPTHESIPDQLKELCKKAKREPSVEQFGENVFVARNYDLTNVVLIKTDSGNVIIDAGISKTSATKMKKDLLAKAPGKIKALILTHSHIDHVGGASVFADDDTEIWATDPFVKNFFKQYGLFRKSELRRGQRQAGLNISDSQLPCIEYFGKRPDLRAVMDSGVRMPNKTFSGETTLEIGGVTIKLTEAHGETTDQLFVWLPKQKILFPGDNIYAAFPNLYTIRGTTARPVNAWIDSLDKMRALQPKLLIPSHTHAVTGQKNVYKVLTNYRDAIQWVRDELVRGVDKGKTIDQLTEDIRLPVHLAEDPNLAEMYGQVDWSIRGIYGAFVGWFDGMAWNLYPMKQQRAALKEVEMMGGEEKVFKAAEQANLAGDPKWAAHLLKKLQISGKMEGEKFNHELARAYKAIAKKVYNFNGKSYLLQTAYELQHDREVLKRGKTDDTILERMPQKFLFTLMSARLDPAKSKDVFESLRLKLTDTNESFIIAVRYGVMEVVKEGVIPDLPEPVATLATDSLSWRKLLVNKEAISSALSGKLTVSGSMIDFVKFMRRFKKGSS